MVTYNQALETLKELYNNEAVIPKTYALWPVDKMSEDTDENKQVVLFELQCINKKYIKDDDSFSEGVTQVIDWVSGLLDVPNPETPELGIEFVDYFEKQDNEEIIQQEVDEDVATIEPESDEKPVDYTEEKEEGEETTKQEDVQEESSEDPFLP